MPSKIVEIKRTNHNVPVYEEGNAEIESWLSLSICAINVRHESRTNPTPYTGLSKQDLMVLLPLLTDFDETQNQFSEFNKQKRMFYNRLIAYIPFGGLKLEIGLTVNDEAEVSNENLPINLMDYIKWKSLFEKDPRIANDKDLGVSHSQFIGYILDKDKTENKEVQFEQMKDDAMIHYLTIKDTLKEVRKYVILMEEVALASDEKDVAILRVRLKKSIEVNPKKFYNIFTDKNSDYYYTIQQLINYGVLEVRPGGGYYDKESTTRIADSKELMLKYVKDEANKEVMTQLKRRYNEKANAPL